MRIKSFRGGVHPPERKDATKNLPIETLLSSIKQVRIPVTQGGVPNLPVVQVGDVVARGQKIAECDAHMGVPVHASIAGIVRKIEMHLVTGNLDASCIVIESDGSGRTAFMPPLDPFSCTKAEALARIRDAGIVGMGGASFPTHVKLDPPKDCHVDVLIANGAECEPYLTIDARVMEEHAEKIVDGVAIAMKITGASEGFIAIEDNKAYLVPILEKAISDQSCNIVGPGACPISVSVCRTKYPEGGEKMLIKALTGREVPSGKLPAHAGCVVQNVSTLKAISEAFREGKPLIDRLLTISGGACETPKNLEVPVGTLVGDLIPDTVRLLPGVKKIIAGGPMMGISMKGADFPIQKNTSGVIFLTARETSLAEEGPCIGCGRCMTACPCLINPVLMMNSVKTGDLDEAKRYGLLDCIECGACAYACPARIKLVQHFRVGKQLARAEAARVAEKSKGAK